MKTEKYEERLSKMVSMSESDMTNKIAELEEKLSNIRKESLGREFNKQDREAEGKEVDINKYSERQEELAKEGKEIATELKRLKAFKEHGKEIMNIRDAASKYLKNLEVLKDKQKGLSEYIQKNEPKIKPIDDEIKRLQSQIEKAKEQKEKAENELNSGSLPKAKQKECLETIETADASIKNLTSLCEKNKNEKLKYEHYNKEKSDVDSKIVATEVNLSALEASWRALLNGKNWNEIQPIIDKITNSRYTAKEGTHEKVEELSEQAEEGKEAIKVAEIPEAEVDGPVIDGSNPAEKVSTSRLPEELDLREATATTTLDDDKEEISPEDEINELLDNNGDKTDIAKPSRFSRFMQSIKNLPSKLADKIKGLREKLFGMQEPSQNKLYEYEGGAPQGRNNTHSETEVDKEPVAETTEKENEFWETVKKETGEPEKVEEIKNDLEELREGENPRKSFVKGLEADEETKNKINEISKNAGVLSMEDIQNIGDKGLEQVKREKKEENYKKAAKGYAEKYGAIYNEQDGMEEQEAGKEDGR